MSYEESPSTLKLRLRIGINPGVRRWKKGRKARTARTRELQKRVLAQLCNKVVFFLPRFRSRLHDPLGTGGGRLSSRHGSMALGVEGLPNAAIVRLGLVWRDFRWLCKAQQSCIVWFLFFCSSLT